MNYASKRDESSWYILCLFLQYPPLSYRFPCHNLKHFIIREPNKGHRQADVPCKLAGHARFFRTKHRLYPIKQIDRPEDEVSHLFRAVFTLKVNHIAGLAVQTHFRRFLCLRFSFFSLLFGLKCDKKSGCACSTSTRICQLKVAKNVNKIITQKSFTLILNNTGLDSSSSCEQTSTILGCRLQNASHFSGLTFFLYVL